MNARAVGAWKGAAVAVVALAVVIGCSSKKSAPTAPPGSNLPPVIAATHPEARSTGVFYDTEIWTEFAEPLDSTTVNSASVYLKVDTQRVPASIRYEAATRRIRIIPQDPLALRRTHTIEISPRVRTLSGGAFPETWFWQFTTNSLRRLGPPDPPTGSVNVSPVAPLLWTQTETTAGDVVYHVFTGTDSAQVAGRSGVSTVTARRYLLASARRPLGARVYWTVRAENRTTGETLDDDVWRFDVVPEGTAIDSMTIPVAWWGSYFSGTRPSLTCNPVTLSSGSNFNSIIKWQIGGIAPGTRVASVVFFGTTTAIVDPNLGVPSVYATTSPVRDECGPGSILFPGPPYSDDALGPLAIGRTEVANVLRFETDLFSSHVQASIARPAFSGYMLRSGRTITYNAAEMRLYYYRLP